MDQEKKVKITGAERKQKRFFKYKRAGIVLTEDEIKKIKIMYWVFLLFLTITSAIFSKTTARFFILVPAEYFTITGVQVNEPIEGQVIIERRGSKVVKKIY